MNVIFHIIKINKRKWECITHNISHSEQQKYQRVKNYVCLPWKGNGHSLRRCFVCLRHHKHYTYTQFSGGCLWLVIILYQTAGHIVTQTPINDLNASQTSQWVNLIYVWSNFEIFCFVFSSVLFSSVDCVILYTFPQSCRIRQSD